MTNELKTILFDQLISYEKIEKELVAKLPKTMEATFTSLNDPEFIGLAGATAALEAVIKAAGLEKEYNNYSFQKKVENNEYRQHV